MSATNIGISTVTRIAFTLIRTSILAVAVGPASGAANRRSDRGHTKVIGVSDKTFGALTGSGVRVTTCVESTIFASTSVNASSIFTGFRPAWAWVASGAKNRLAVTAGEGVAHHAL